MPLSLTLVSQDEIQVTLTPWPVLHYIVYYVGSSLGGLHSASHPPVTMQIHLIKTLFDSQLRDCVEVDISGPERNGSEIGLHDNFACVQ
jgi:hypothetical protein